MRSSTEDNPIWIRPRTEPEPYLQPGRMRIWIAGTACLCTGAMFAALPALITSRSAAPPTVVNKKFRPVDPPDIRPAPGLTTERGTAPEVTAIIRRNTCPPKLARQIKSWIPPMLDNAGRRHKRALKALRRRGCRATVRFRLTKRGRITKASASGRCPRSFLRLVRRSVRKWRLLPGCPRTFAITHKFRR